jgi:hypothetical protein
MSRMEQIRRAHANARPNSVVNPAWANTHNDLTYVLQRYDTLLAFLCAVENVLDTEAETDVAYKGRFKLIRSYAEQARAAVAKERS